MSDVLVYRVHRGATRWHWPDPTLRWLASACSSWQLLAHNATDPADVSTDEQCRGKGCRERWTVYRGEAAS